MRLLAALVALGLVAAACGDDDGGGPDDTPSDALTSAIADSLVSDSPGGIGEDEANCIAAGLLEDVGLARLAELGVTVESAPNLEFEDLDPEVQEATTNVLATCMDIRALFVEGAAAEGDISDESIECISGAITEEQVQELASGALRGVDVEASPVFAEILQLFVRCLTPEELQQLGE